MSAFRKRSKSLDHFDVQDFKPFRPQRIVCFKLYAQEERSRLTTLYPFLTQEQIFLKVKDKWNRMENELKQNYTKAVLYATPTRKTESRSPRKPELFQTRDGKVKKSSDEGHVGFQMPATSKTKVADWLNDPKQKSLTDQRNVQKIYDGASYTLPYVPTVIDPTPTKQPGILKSNSSEKKENERKTSKNPRQHSRVSFSPNSEAQGKKENDHQKEKNTKSSEKKGKAKTCLESKFTNINDVFDFEVKTAHEAPKEVDKTKKQDTDKRKLNGEQAKKGTCKYNIQELVFEEDTEEELFTTPEMAKLPLQEISKAPKKRKSSSKRGSSKVIPPKTKQIKTMPEGHMKVGSMSNNNNSIVSDVFGRKAWAASTYTRKIGSRKMIPEKKSEKGKKKKMKFKKDQQDQFIQREEGILLGPFQSDSDEENNPDFIRDEKGLLVGPIGCDFDEDMDDQPIISDESGHELEMDEKFDVQGKEHICFKPSLDHAKKELPSTKRKTSKGKKKQDQNQVKAVPCLELKEPERESYTCDFDGLSISSSQSPEKSRSVKPRNKVKKKSLNEVVESLMEDSNDQENMKYETVSPFKPELVTLCKDFAVDKPVSPIISETGDSNLSDNATENTASPASIDGGGNPTLMKVLLRMKQITCPNILDIGDASPKLLSPTLSGITELSSLSTESSATKDNIEDSYCHSLLRKSRTRPACDVKEPLEGEVFPELSKSTPRSSRGSRQSEGENILCSMFQDMTPPEAQQKTGRRLVSSNKRQRRSNFDNMFEERDIFV